jgi:hypothetical protein
MDRNSPEYGDQQLEIQHAERWTLIRDTAVLQVKLVVDGLRDLVLVPASLIAAVASLLTSRDGKPGPQFDRLMDAGRRSEKWIDLFGTHRELPAPDASADENHEGGIDIVVRRFESFLVDEYRRGGLTRQAKARIDKALNAMQSKHPEPDDEKGKES